MNDPVLSVIVPAYNEARHLATVASEMISVLDASGLSYEIVLVDNGSTDNTPLVISDIERKHVWVRHIRLERNAQYGGGILAGLGVARGEMLGWIHADGQANPEDIVRLYKLMTTEGNELAKTVRVERHESRWRLFQSFVYFTIFQILYWSPYRDINATPRIMSRRAYDMFKLESRDWFIDPEFVIKALRFGMPISELETVWRKRRTGKTRAHLLTGLEFLKNMILYRLYVK